MADMGTGPAEDVKIKVRLDDREAVGGFDRIKSSFAGMASTVGTALKMFGGGALMGAAAAIPAATLFPTISNITSMVGARTAITGQQISQWLGLNVPAMEAKAQENALEATIQQAGMAQLTGPALAGLYGANLRMQMAQGNAAIANRNVLNSKLFNELGQKDLDNIGDIVQTLKEQLNAFGEAVVGVTRQLQINGQPYGRRAK